MAAMTYLTLLRLKMGLLLSIGITCLSTGSQNPPVNKIESRRISPQDVLTVVVARHPELSGEYLVPTDGRLQLPGVGDVVVTNMTISSLRQSILKQLAKQELKKPEVFVNFKSVRVERVFVFGPLRSPGALPLDHELRLSQALASAGGLAPDQLESEVTLSLERSGAFILRKVSISEALAMDAAEPIILQAGDIVRVEPSRQLQVYVAGKVKLPGLYRVKSESNMVLSAIAAAGDILDDASMKVRVIHNDGRADEIVDLALRRAAGEQAPPVQLGSGDIVVVNPLLARFTVLGYVARAGQFPLRDDRKYQITDALAASEGASTKRGRLTRVALIRLNPKTGKPTSTIYNVSRYLTGHDATQNPELENGDVLYVPETDKVDLTTLLSAASTSALILNALKR